MTSHPFKVAAALEREKSSITIDCEKTLNNQPTGSRFFYKTVYHPNLHKIDVIKQFSRTHGMSSLHMHKRLPIQCHFDKLHESLLHNILRMLPLQDLLAAQQTCTLWRKVILSSKYFHKQYDEKSKGNDDTYVVLHSGSNSFPLFKITDQNGGHSVEQFNLSPPKSEEWFLKAAIDGLLLFATRKGMLKVIHPWTMRERLLPVTPFTWNPRSTTVRVFIVSISVEKLFKVCLCGYFTSIGQRAMTYNSFTNSWSWNHMKATYPSPRRSTFNGTDIMSLSYNDKDLDCYDVESNLNRVVSIKYEDSCLEPFLSRGLINHYVFHMFVYHDRVFQLTGLRRSFNARTRYTEIFIWEGNTTGTVYTIFMKIELLAHYNLSVSSDPLISYDGEHCIVVIPRSRSQMLRIDLKTKRWNVLNCNPVILNNLRRLKRARGDYRRALAAFLINPKLDTVI